MVNLTGLETAQLYQNQLKQYQDNAKGINDTMASLYRLKQEQDYATQKAAAEAAAKERDYRNNIIRQCNEGLIDERSRDYLLEQGYTSEATNNNAVEVMKLLSQGNANVNANNYAGMKTFNSLPPEAQKRFLLRNQHMSQSQQGDKIIYATADSKQQGNKYAGGGGVGSGDKGFVLNKEQLKKLREHIMENGSLDEVGANKYLAGFLKSSKNDEYELKGILPTIIMNYLFGNAEWRPIT